MAEFLVQRGHQVHIVTANFDPADGALPVVRHVISGGHDSMRFAEEAARCLRGVSLDIVHDAGDGCFCNILQPHAGSLRSLTRHKLRSYPVWARPLKRLLNAFSARQRSLARLASRQAAAPIEAFIAVSNFVARGLVEFDRIPAERIRVIHNGVNTERFSPANRVLYRRAIRDWLGVDERTTLLLIVAHNYRLKGLEPLLLALTRLVRRNRPVKLMVVGGNPRAWNLRIRWLNLSDHVHLVGRFRDAAPFYAAADVYVHPTFYDACSLVVLEAMASGLPVITSRFNGAAELLEPGVDGLIIDDPWNIQALQQAIELASVPEVNREMGIAARNKALQHRFGKVAESVLRLYHELLGKEDVPGSFNACVPTRAAKTF